eukprot:6381590-Amphidinium_carterae.1
MMLMMLMLRMLVMMMMIMMPLLVVPYPPDSNKHEVYASLAIVNGIMLLRPVMPLQPSMEFKDTKKLERTVNQPSNWRSIQLRLLRKRVVVIWSKDARAAVPPHKSYSQSTATLPKGGAKRTHERLLERIERVAKTLARGQTPKLQKVSKKCKKSALRRGFSRGKKLDDGYGVRLLTWLVDDGWSIFRALHTRTLEPP